MKALRRKTYLNYVINGQEPQLRAVGIRDAMAGNQSFGAPVHSALLKSSQFPKHPLPHNHGSIFPGGQMDPNPARC